MPLRSRHRAGHTARRRLLRGGRPRHSRPAAYARAAVLVGLALCAVLVVGGLALGALRGAAPEGRVDGGDRSAPGGPAGSASIGTPAGNASDDVLVGAELVPATAPPAPGEGPAADAPAADTPAPRPVIAAPSAPPPPVVVAPAPPDVPRGWQVAAAESDDGAASPETDGGPAPPFLGPDPVRDCDVGLLGVCVDVNAPVAGLAG